MRKNIWGLLSVVLVCLYPCLFMYFRNAGEAQLRDITGVAILFIGVAVVLELVFWLVFRSASKALCFTNCAMLVICNFGFCVQLMDNMQWRYKELTIAIIALLILYIIGTFLYKKDESIVLSVNMLYFIVFGALILISGLPAIPTISEKMNAPVEKKSDVSTFLNTDSTKEEDAPNIYLMLFDEYAGPENLDYYYHFDNADFEKYLEKNHFNCSEDSYNMESTNTYTCISNLLNLDYVVNDDMPQEVMEQYLDAYIYDVLEQLGYDINTVSYSEFLYEGRSKHSYKTTSLFEEKTGYFVLKNSAFIYLYNLYADSKDSYGEELKESMNYYKNFANLPKEESAPQFNLGYFPTPHMVFYYREDGSCTPKEDYADWEDQSNYLEYLKWTNHRIEEIVDYILEQDPNSIIIIQSDHGARYVKHSYEVDYDAEGLDTIYEKNILNVVYYKGKQFDIEGLSGINTLRTILNEEFDANFEMLEYDSGE